MRFLDSNYTNDSIWRDYIRRQNIKGLFTWTRDSELPRGNECPGASVTLRSHDIFLSLGKLKVIWSLRNYLNSFTFHINCYREWISNTFTYFWCFLELCIEKFISNTINEHVQDYSCPGATLALCSHREKLPRQGGQQKTYVNSYRHQTVHRGKVDSGVSELPQGNELSRDHMNRPCFELPINWCKLFIAAINFCSRHSFFTCPSELRSFTG